MFTPTSTCRSTTSNRADDDEAVARHAEGTASCGCCASCTRAQRAPAVSQGLPAAAWPRAGYGDAIEVQNLRKQDVGDILISPVELETRSRLSRGKISRELPRAVRSFLVGVLKGVTFFPRRPGARHQGAIRIDYLDLKRYAGARRPIASASRAHRTIPIAGQHVLIVETSSTPGSPDYVAVRAAARESPPRSRSSPLRIDRCAAWSSVPVRYVGFKSQRLRGGYGLDYRELYRNLPFICTCAPAPRNSHGPNPSVPPESIR